MIRRPVCVSIGERWESDVELTADFKFGGEPLEKSLILDELFHSLSEKLLRGFLALTARIESAPETIDLVLDVFRVGD